MIETEDVDPEKFFRDFSKHLLQIDEPANVILRGHLLVENDLDSVLRATFFYPEFIQDRLSFERKAQMARAMALRTQNEAVWETLSALNALRNEIAHNRDPRPRKAKLNRLRQACLKQIKSEFSAKHRDDDDREIVTLGCALCSGFLGLLEDQLWSARDIVNQVDEEVYPDAERMPSRPPEDDS
jgi:hypothetical protein